MTDNAMSGDIRQRAEMILQQREAESTEELREMTRDLRTLVHELHVHQVELEIQNEELKKTQQALESSRDRYAELYDSVPVGYLTLDSHGVILEANLTAARLLGVERTYLQRKPFITYLAPDSHATFYTHLRRTRQQSQAGHFSCEVQVLRRNQGMFYAYLESRPVNEGEQADPVQFHSVLMDISDRKHAEMELNNYRAHLESLVSQRTSELTQANHELRREVQERQRAEKAKSEFLANMSHELRTPLNSILGMVEAMQEQVYGPIDERQGKCLRIVEESSRHLLSLINDVLDITKIGAGKVTLEPQPVMASEVGEASLRLVRQSAHSKRLRLEKSYDPNVDEIMVDNRRLKQILVNLLGNAIKFTPEGGKVGLEIHGDRENCQVHFEVWDTGIGIPEIHLPRLFHAFEQLDSSLSRQHEGSGLGLALVYHLTELHGGSVEVQSIEGRGSRFRITLPWQQDSVESQQERETRNVSLETQDHSVPLQGIVLLAEDNHTNALMLTTYLESRGCTVYLARNGKEALDMARRYFPDVILMDIQMPEMDGLEAIGRLRQDSTLNGIPIIALTALVMPGDRERCLEAGANEYLTKPMELRRLSAILQAYLSRASGA